MKPLIQLLTILICTLSSFAIQAQSHSEYLDSARVFYERGEYDLAAGLFYKIAKEGNPQGMLELAFMLRDGVGIEKDEEKALEYFEGAADKGLTYSFQPLAELYEKKGLIEEALVFYKLAAKEFPENNKKLALLLFGEENYEEALPYVKKLTKQKDGDGIFLLGVMYYEGLGLEAHEKNGLKYLKRAAEMGHPSAINFLKDIQNEKLLESEDYDTEFNDDDDDDEL